MSSSIRHRLLNQMARNAAWTSSAWLVVMVGCVDSPKESFTPVESAATSEPAATSGEQVLAEQAEPSVLPPEPVSTPDASVALEPLPFEPQPAVETPQPTRVAEAGEAPASPGLFPIPDTEPQPEVVEGEPLPLTPDDQEVASSPAEPEHASPQPTVADLATDPFSQLTPEADPSPELAEGDAGNAPQSTPAPFPGEEAATTSLDPVPDNAEPLPEDGVAGANSSEAAAPQPAPAPGTPAAGEPVMNANATPVDANKPKGYIHINPKPRTAENASVPNGTVNQNAVGKAPAPAAPPTSGADAAALTPSPASESTDEESVVESSTDSAVNGTPVSPVSISSKGAGSSSDMAIPEGFTSLFNNQDLTGWEVVDGKPDSWEFKDGVLSCVAPGGGWVQTLAMYSDFELRFQYQLSPGGNSGVSLRYPGHGNPSLEGLEIQLIDDHAEKYADIQPQQATGSLYFAAAPQVRDAALPAGNWNHCAIRCVGQRLEVTINDKLVNEIDLSQINTRVDGVSRPISSVRSPMGTIALQSHSTRVDFRGVVLRDLTQALASGVRWLDLQEGAGEAVTANDKVTVHYIAHLSTGKRFANSVEKNKPVSVELRDVIPGWREGIPGMKVGGKRRLVVPPAMAYGEKGFKEIVPPNSTLVYEIELLEFVPGEDEVPLETAEAAPTEAETK